MFNKNPRTATKNVKQNGIVSKSISENNEIIRNTPLIKRRTGKEGGEK